MIQMIHTNLWSPCSVLKRWDYFYNSQWSTLRLHENKLPTAALQELRQWTNVTNGRINASTISCCQSAQASNSSCRHLRQMHLLVSSTIYPEFQSSWRVGAWHGCSAVSNDQGLRFYARNHRHERLEMWVVSSFGSPRHTTALGPGLPADLQGQLAWEAAPPCRLPRGPFQHEDRAPWNQTPPPYLGPVGSWDFLQKAFGGHVGELGEVRILPQRNPAESPESPNDKSKCCSTYHDFNRTKQ